MSAGVFSLWVRVWAGSLGPGGQAGIKRAAGDGGCFAASMCTGHSLEAGKCRDVRFISISQKMWGRYRKESL